MTTSSSRSGKRGAAPKPRQTARTRGHPCATTTPSIRRAIQESEEKDVVLADRYSVNRKTIAKWKARDFESDQRMGPKNRRASPLPQKDEAIVLAYRWHTRLALNDVHFRLRRLMPKLTRSKLYRCLKRYGLSRIGSTAPSPRLTAAALRGPYVFEITALEVAFRDPDEVLGVVYPVFLAIEEITQDVYAKVATPTPESAAAFLECLVNQFPQRIIAVTTDIYPAFTDWRAGFNENMAAVGAHPFAVACRAYHIAHTRSPPPRTKPPKLRLRGVEIL